MKRILTLLLCISIIYAHAATTIPASTLSSAHWTLSGSPYQITGHIIVANNDSLVIDPGVVVEFQGKYKLFCNGKIIANGTPSQHILFTAANHTTGWLGIRYDNTPTTNGQSSFQYCTIEYGHADVTGDNLGGAMYFNNFSNCVISNSVIQNCYSTYAGAIYGNYASPTVLQDSFYNNSCYAGGGCIQLCYSTSVIEGCLFKDAGVTGYYSSLKITNNYFKNCIVAGGVSSFSLPTTGYLEIMHNVFDSCSQTNGGGGGAILLSNAQAKIEHNVFKNNVSACGGGAISCWTQTAYSNASNVVISNNLFYGNKSHIFIGAGAPFGGGAISFSNCSGKVINNTIANNHSDTLGGAIICFGGSSPSFYNNIIYGNITDDGNENIFILDNLSDPNFYRNDIEGGYLGINTNGTPLVGANVNNIDSLPNFTNPSTGIYTLNTGSPCIDKGDTATIGAKIPAKDLAGAIRIMGPKIDMGCYESVGYLPCDSPAHLNILNVTATTATIVWDSVAAAIGYEYYTGVSPVTTTPTGISTTNDTAVLTGLIPNTKYDFCVRTKCASSLFFSAWICDTFRTTTLGIGEVPVTVASIYPNPNHGTFTVALQNNHSNNAVITVLDVTGREVYKFQMTGSKFQVDLGNAAKGIYMVKVQLDDAVITKRVTVE